MTSLRDDLATLARGWRWTRRPLPPRSAAAFVRVRDRREFPTEWARSRTAQVLREAIQTAILRPLVWSEVAPRVTGSDLLDRLAPPVVFVSNHASHLDAPLVLCSLPQVWRQRTAVAAASDYFFDAWWRAVGTAMAFNTFPIDRGGGRLSDTPAQLIEDGWNLLIFPEGTRSPDGWMQRFRRGTALVCSDLGVPAVPIAIRGSYAAMPRGRGWPTPGRPPVSVRFGPPVMPSAGEAAHDFSARLEQAVARLLDEDATTWWESLRRDAAGRTPPAAGPAVARWRRIWETSRPPEPRQAERVWKR